MFKRILNFLHYWSILLVLPLLGGCKGGGLFSGGDGGGSSFAALSGGGGDGGGASFATIHSPEPASMLLMGAGMMAVAYYKKRMKK